jgi:hypothetical protein
VIGGALSTSTVPDTRAGFAAVLVTLTEPLTCVVRCAAVGTGFALVFVTLTGTVGLSALADPQMSNAPAREHAILLTGIFDPPFFGFSKS